jgi:hypothetical protein
MKSELGQSVDHFKRAAALAAQETSATVGPKFYAARDRVQPAAVKARGAATGSWESTLAALTPLIAAATENIKQSGKETVKATRKSAKADRKDTQKSARRAAKLMEKRANKAVDRKKSSGRGGKLVGLALVGAAVGAGAAFMARRRKAAQWDEYDPSAPITSTQQVGADDAAFEPSNPTGSTTSTTTTTPSTTTTTTPSTGAVAAADPALAGETTDVTTDVATDATLAVDAAGDVTDQTSSPQHSPTVARMASGQNKD